ncbi:hypothetical protein COT47_04150, partial [Candidatus Woesearchaeota archaeon CG08_land_8_20_14_0_20_43_7]
QYDSQAKYPRILALTASPGSDFQKISEVCSNLFINEVEIRTDKDPDVMPYVQPINVRWINVEFPTELNDVHKYLKDCYHSKIKEVSEHGYIKQMQVKDISKRELLGMQAGLHAQISRGNKEFEILKSVSLLAEALKVEHAIELVETQGINAAYSYMESMNSSAMTSKVKAVQNLARDLNFRSALIKARNLVEKNTEHPKMKKIKEIIETEITDDDNKKIIIFANFRDTAKHLEGELNKIEGVRAKLFVGQAKKNGSGLSQKEQKQILDDFRSGNHNILVATSVAEEGLDIPKVDLVCFYEPTPSSIRHIQRRGRTGRQKSGRVLVLVTKGTRDEGYRWSAHHKEKRMHRVLDEFKNKIKLHLHKNRKDNLQSSLSNFMKSVESEIRIIADYREKGSPVIKELVDGKIDMTLASMDVGDFMLSSRVGVEFKTVSDFVDSIVDGRLLDQAKKMKEHYERPLFVIEGEEDIYSQRNIHSNAIRGMISMITVSYGIPILFTKNFKDTAATLAMIAKREQDETSKEFNPHPMKKQSSFSLQQQYLISSIPGIGPTLARPILEKFGTIKSFVNASLEEIKEIDKIGDKKAETIKKLLEREYDG